MTELFSAIRISKFEITFVGLDFTNRFYNIVYTRKETDMKRGLLAFVILVLMIVSTDCGRKVMVPPRIDLKAHEVVGMIHFQCENKGELAPLTTRKYTEAIRRDQEMTRIIDLGTQAEVLREIGHDRLNKAAFQAIGEEYDVATVFTGELLISDVRPDISIALIFVAGMSVSAEVDATLDVQMVETESGASLWSTSVTKTREIGNVTIWEGGGFGFDAEDPERAYGKLVNALVEDASQDFRVTWRRE
jgi:hypothetical protein